MEVPFQKWDALKNQNLCWLLVQVKQRYHPHLLRMTWLMNFYTKQRMGLLDIDWCRQIPKQKMLLAFKKAQGHAILDPRLPLQQR